MNVETSTTAAPEQGPVRKQRYFDPKTRKVVEFGVRSIRHKYKPISNRELLDKYFEPSTTEAVATPLAELGLLASLRNTLSGHGIQSIEDLAQRAELGPLTDFDGIDEQADKAIRVVLAQRAVHGAEPVKPSADAKGKSKPSKTSE